MAGLFDDVNPLQQVPTNVPQQITKGSMISFDYPKSMAKSPNVIHDSRPMLIITDIWPTYIRGVNLHYLTFPYVKKLLTQQGGNTGFGYGSIKGDAFLANAFRTYNRMGIRRIKRLDTDWLMQVLASVRSFSPGELEKIRANIKDQINQRIQTKASELNTVAPQQQSGPNQSQPIQNAIKPITPVVTPTAPTTQITGNQN